MPLAKLLWQALAGLDVDKYTTSDVLGYKTTFNILTE